MNDQVNVLRNCFLSQSSYPILWVHALYKKVCVGDRTVSKAVRVVCGENAHGQRDILAIEPMLKESE
ncbi:MAG TPA: transposase [Candidatus Fournierella merdigallinarum]|nr:transposase [Candidatus Fournierella merdigallinarum]